MQRLLAARLDPAGGAAVSQTAFCPRCNQQDLGPQHHECADALLPHRAYLAQKHHRHEYRLLQPGIESCGCGALRAAPPE